jgi:hypothetical protein
METSNKNIDFDKTVDSILENNHHKTIKSRKRFITQFFKVEIFQDKTSRILFPIAFILGISLIILSKFSFFIIWPVCLFSGWTILLAIEDFKDKVCPHCYGELEVIEESINLLSIQKKTIKNCKECGKEFSSTAHYLD